jgi:hypothetical protein
MMEKPVDLDTRRGMVGRRDVELRRKLRGVQAQQHAMHIREEEFEIFLQGAPATTLLEAAARAKYLIQLFAETKEARGSRRQDLITTSLEEIDRFFE